MWRPLPLLGALLLITTSCGGKDVGELCQEDSDCESDSCRYASSPAARGSLQCTQSCDESCPDGSVCVDGSCKRECSSVGSDACAEGTACYPTLGACFATCSDDSECGNNTCSSLTLCDGVP